MNKLAKDLLVHIDVMNESDAAYVKNLAGMRLHITKGNIANLEAIAGKHGLCGFGKPVEGSKKRKKERSFD